jgi:dipeptidyl aminopeptidase/acylaminoacyl peptidase
MQAPLIPRNLLFGNPDRGSPSLSPDGTKIAFLAPLDGVLNVWVGPADDWQAAVPVTKDKRRGIYVYFWAYTNAHVLYLQDKDGDENWRVYSVCLESGDIRDLTPFEAVHAQVQEVSRHFPDEILVGLNNRKPQWHDVHRVNIRTGESSLVLQNDGFAGVMTDEQFRVRFATTYTPEASRVVVKFREDGGTDPFMTIGPEDMTTSAIEFNEAGDAVYMLDSRGRNTAALTLVDIESQESTVLAEDPRVDIFGVMIHPTKKRVQAYATNYTRTEWHALGEGVKGDLMRLQALTHGEFHVISRTLDDSRWIVACDLDDGPTRYYVWDRPLREARFLFTNRPELEGQPLVKLHPEVIKSRDGLDLVCYLSLPLDADPDGDRRPREPLPLVLEVHGGPWARDTWGLLPVHQWLANRDYAVLSVNFRGSAGFGKDFLNAGNHEWAGRMHDDLIDAVNWAVSEGIADGQRVAIMGGSYGGYATLVGLTFTPGTFACGVDIVGPSSLMTLLNNVPEYWIPILPVLKDRVGDPATDEGRALLQQRSPLTYADRIVRPLLIGQGANDPRVKQQESDQIVQAMREHGIPVTYVLYPDEGHGFARPENRMSFFAVTEAFLAQHLGGRYEPIGDAFRGATIQCPVGADDVPGLPAALTSRPPG